MNKKCDNGKILNPITNRCVSITGKIGQGIGRDARGALQGR